VCTNQANRAIVGITFNSGRNAYPARLSVARSNDAILCEVITGYARYRIEKLLFYTNSIFGMNARNPILVRFVDRARWQAVDRKIFRRPAISKAIPNVDLHSANTRDPMNECELGLSRLQLPDQLLHIDGGSLLFDSAQYNSLW
jgi:hypothetical protein